MQQANNEVVHLALAKLNREICFSIIHTGTNSIRSGKYRILADTGEATLIPYTVDHGPAYQNLLLPTEMPVHMPGTRMGTYYRESLRGDHHHFERNPQPEPFPSIDIDDILYQQLQFAVGRIASEGNVEGFIGLDVSIKNTWSDDPSVEHVDTPFHADYFFAGGHGGLGITFTLLTKKELNDEIIATVEGGVMSVIAKGIASVTTSLPAGLYRVAMSGGLCWKNRIEQWETVHGPEFYGTTIPDKVGGVPIANPGLSGELMACIGQFLDADTMPGIQCFMVQIDYTGPNNKHPRIGVTAELTKV